MPCARLQRHFRCVQQNEATKSNRVTCETNNFGRCQQLVSAAEARERERERARARISIELMRGLNEIQRGSDATQQVAGVARTPPANCGLDNGERRRTGCRGASRSQASLNLNPLKPGGEHDDERPPPERAWWPTASGRREPGNGRADEANLCSRARVCAAEIERLDARQYRSILRAGPLVRRPSNLSEAATAAK